MTYELARLYGTHCVLEDGSKGARRVHLFDDREIDAIDAALRTQRALLLRGEPGVGKSQLAEAFAATMGWELFRATVDANTDPDELKWFEDSVERLSRAQYAGSGQGYSSIEELETALQRERFIRPGPLWQAFQSKTPAAVLIDEIDKADVSVPNALLEAFGSGRFKPPGHLPEVTATRWPLVILTTNEDRPLPPAFVRRCLVHNMDPPKEIRKWLIDRGTAVYGAEHADFLGEVADAVLEDRSTAEELRIEPLPGLAEYLDLLRVLFSDGAKDIPELRRDLAKFRDFVLVKHRVR